MSTLAPFGPQTWEGYTLGDQLGTDWTKMGASSQYTIQTFFGSKSLAMNTGGWGAVVYNARTFSTAALGLTFQMRCGQDRANCAWNLESTLLDGATNLRGYLWQYIPSTGASVLATGWQGGIGYTFPIDTQTHAVADPNNFLKKVVHVGSLIKCYLDGVLVHTVTDTTRSFGYIGFNGLASTTYVDNVLLDDNVSPPPPPPPPPPTTALETLLQNPNVPAVFLATVTAGKYLPFWAPYSASAWMVTEADEVSGVRSQGVALTAVTSVLQVEATAGSFYWDGSQVYCHLAAGVDPNTVVVQGILRYRFADRDTDFGGIFWEGRIMDLPALSMRLEPEFGGVSQIGGGRLSLANADGFFDTRRAPEFQWEAGETKLVMGAVGLAYSDFVTLNTWANDGLEPDDAQAVLALVERKDLLSKAVPLEVYTLDEFPTMKPEHAGRAKQLAYGIIKGAEPVCISTESQTFRVANHAIQGFDGVRVLAGETWNPVSFSSSNPALGEFTLDSVAWDGQATVAVDFRGRLKTDGSLMNNASDVVKDILAQAGETNINANDFAQSYSALDKGYYAPNILNRYSVRAPSLYLNEQGPALDIIQRINKVVKSWLFTDADGAFSYVVFRPQQGKNLTTFSEADADLLPGYKELPDENQERPSVVRVKWGADLAGEWAQVTEIHRAKNAWLQGQATALPTEIEADLASERDARRLAQAELTQANKPPIYYEIKVKWRAFLKRVSDQVRLVRIRNPQDRVAVVIETKVDLKARNVTLRLANMFGFDMRAGFWVSSTDTTPTGGTLAWNATDQPYKRQNSGHWHDPKGFATLTPVGAQDHDTSVWV